MNLTTTTETVQVVKHQLEITDAELRAALADPAAFARQLKQQLNGHGGGKSGMKTKGGRQARQAKPGKKPHQAKSPNGRKPERRVQCPHCPARVRASFLPKHVERQHPSVAAAPAAE